jgi:hypothetical protein
MIKLYLDQNAWIYLSKSYYGIDKDTTLSEICSHLMKSSDEGCIICPLSVNHIIESLKHYNKDRRKRFAEFIIKVSKGYTIFPYSKIIPWEIKNAVNGLFGKEQLDLSKRVIGKGISFSLGAKAIIKGDISKEIKDMLTEKLESSDALKMLLSGEYSTESFHKVNSDGKRIENDLITNIEKIRKEDNEIKDKELRYRVCATKHFRDMILPSIIKTLDDLGISFQTFQTLTSGWSEEHMFNFFRQIPTSFCDFTLTYKRDRNIDRPVKRNDLFDIAALSIAIPYCDIVVTEAMFASIALQAKLDKLYNTKILNNIIGIRDYL